MLEIMNGLYLTSSLALQNVQLLALHMPTPVHDDAHRAYAMYQHLYQEMGLLGYHLSTSSSSSSADVAPCMDGHGTQGRLMAGLMLQHS